MTCMRAAQILLFFSALWIVTNAKESTYGRYKLSGKVVNVDELKRKVDFSGNDTHFEIFGTGSKDERNLLRRYGLFVEDFIKGRPFRDIAFPSGYHNPSELLREMENLVTKDPKIAMIIDLMDAYNIPRTADGRTVKAIKISDNVASYEDEPNFIFVANCHAREVVTPEIALDTAKRLVNGYGSDPEITEIVDQNQIVIVWTFNPDGLEYVWSTDNNWRKNRRNNGGGTFGVDMNRNFPFGWTGFPGSGSTSPSSNTYRGPSGGSEPEVQAVIALQEDYVPDKVLDWHSSGRDVRPCYGSSGELPVVMNDYFEDIATKHAETMNYKLGNAIAMGTQRNNAYHTFGAVAELVETATSFQPSGNVMKEEVVRVWPGTLFWINLNIPLSGHVKNGQGVPIRATIEILNIDFFYGESNYANPKNGRYHVWLPTGQRTVRFTAPGYSPVEFTIQIPSSGIVREVVMSELSNQQQHITGE